MNTAAMLVVLLNFGLIGFLPVIFFRRDGNLSLAWFATAVPFFITGCVLVLGIFGQLAPQLKYDSGLYPVLQLLAVFLSAISIALISLTIGSHRIPLALWHQDNDAPVELVTWGAYTRIRHPFYSGFLLAFAASCMVFPHAITLVSACYGAAALTVTALREEQRLGNSEFGVQYRNYMQRSGRFLPWPEGTRHG